MPPTGLPLAPGDHGPDVSSYQPNTDWVAVSGAGYTFAFVKATEGTNYVNPEFARDWQQMAASGLVRGAYHFGRPDVNSAQAEVDWFLSHVSFQGNDIAVLDLEVGNGDLKDWTIAFGNSLLQNKMLYSGVPFMREHNLDNAEVAAAFNNKLWIAAYQQSTPQLPNGWTELTFWQHTDRQDVPGVQGACDCSVHRP